MLSVRISSYEDRWEVWRAREKRKSCSRRSTAKSMNQFFYNIVTTKYRKVDRGKQVLFVIDYKILSMRCTKNKGSYQLFTNTSQWYGLDENVSSENVNENLLLWISLYKIKISDGNPRLSASCKRHFMDARQCVCWEMYHDDANRN